MLFLALVEIRAVPVLLPGNLEEGLLTEYVARYRPNYICRLSSRKSSAAETQIVFRFRGYVIASCRGGGAPVHEELAFLMSTSGSTGSPKAVRFSYRNLRAAADNVAGIFALTNEDKGLINIPVYFVQGLMASLAHLYAGGAVLVSDLSLMSRAYWDLLESSRCTFITGVPFSYEVMVKLGLLKKELPDLKIVNVGGGRPNDQLWKSLAEWAAMKGKRLIMTYGATETGSRMMYLPPELALRKAGSIGRATLHGRMTLVDENGCEIREVGTQGEMVYYGDIVSMGYAVRREDLDRGDERHGRYETGDLAYFDEDGCYYVTGRKSRFTKIYGYRIGLDEVERLLKDRFRLSAACTGDDVHVQVYVEQPVEQEEVIAFLSKTLHLLPGVFQIIPIEAIPRNSAGKVLYAALNEYKEARINPRGESF